MLILPVQCCMSGHCYWVFFFSVVFMADVTWLEMPCTRDSQKTTQACTGRNLEDKKTAHVHIASNVPFMYTYICDDKIQKGRTF